MSAPPAPTTQAEHEVERGLLLGADCMGRGGEGVKEGESGNVLTNTQGGQVMAKRRVGQHDMWVWAGEQKVHMKPEDRGGGSYPKNEVCFPFPWGTL